MNRGLDLEYLATALLAPLDLDLFYYQHRVQGLPAERISGGVRALVPRAIDETTDRRMRWNSAACTT